jgi:predicted RNA-binding protein with RPS1 domain
MNAQKVNRIRVELVQNIREGKSPQSLAEKRRIENERKEAEEQKRKLKEKEEKTFGEVATEFIKWAKTNKKDWGFCEGKIPTSKVQFPKVNN